MCFTPMSYTYELCLLHHDGEPLCRRSVGALCHHPQACSRQQRRRDTVSTEISSQKSGTSALQKVYPIASVFALARRDHGHKNYVGQHSARWPGYRLTVILQPHTEQELPPDWYYHGDLRLGGAVEHGRQRQPEVLARALPGYNQR